MHVSRIPTGAVQNFRSFDRNIDSPLNKSLLSEQLDTDADPDQKVAALERENASHRVRSLVWKCAFPLSLCLKSFKFQKFAVIVSPNLQFNLTKISAQRNLRGLRPEGPRSRAGGRRAQRACWNFSSFFD